MTPVGRREVAQLHDMRDLFRRTDRELHALAKHVMEARGISDDMLDEYVELISEGLTSEQALEVAFPLSQKS